MRIETRFTWIIALCFGFGLLIAGYISYRLEDHHAREEVKLKADMLLETSLAVRAYTQDEVAGLVSGLRTADFPAQQVPSYAAQDAIRRVTRKFSGYSYRESSLNPTNLADRASDWEVGLVRAFEADPRRQEIFGETGSAKDPRYYVARPIRMGSPACLQCHSTPAAAPAAMVAHYGPVNGFGWRMNDVIGLQIVEVPTAPARLKALDSVLLTVASLSCVFVLSAVVLFTLLRRHVSQPLEALTAAAMHSSVDPRAGPAGPAVGGQFGDVQQAILRLRTSVDHALRLLERRPGGRPGDELE